MGRLPVIGTKWRLFGLLSVAAVALFALAACGGAEEAPATAPAPAQQAAAPAATAVPAAPAPAPAATTAPAAAAAPTAAGGAGANRRTQRPLVAGTVTITMGIPEVSEQFGDFEVQTYGGSPGEIQHGLLRPASWCMTATDPLSPFVAEKWTINDAGDTISRLTFARASSSRPRTHSQARTLVNSRRMTLPGT